MRNIDLLRRTALCSASLAAVMAFGSPAFAQSAGTTVPQPPACDPNDSTDPDCQPGQSEQEIESGTVASADAQGGDSIVVTGSRIRRPNLESQVPVTSIGGEEFFQQGNNNVGDTLNELPQLRSTFGQANAGRFLGTTGLNLLDLRGLGTQRTLVLVNGRRHVASDILNNAVSPDVNTIPNDLIERVDVVTGGNSAIYGSDAIAGVVNFILRRDFEGLQVRGNAGISEEGFGGNQYVSVLAGMNFGDGRGNITAHAEFAHADRVFGSDINFLRTANAFLTTDVDPAGLAQNSDQFPDSVLFRDVRSASIFRSGLIPIPQQVANPVCGTGLASTNGGPSTITNVAGQANGVPFNCNLLFTNEGGIFQQTGTRVGTGTLGSFVGGNGPTGREGELLSVLPFQERMNFNVLAHYEITPAIEAFVEAKFVRVDTQGQQSTPAFIQGNTLFDFRERPRLDNPFLSGDARGAIANAILASGCNTSLTVACSNARGSDLSRGGTGLGVQGPLNAADRAAIANGSYRFVVSRFLADLGGRDEDSQRDTYRIVAGLRGTFNDDWSYELSGNYGRVEEDTTVLGNIIPQRFLLAMDAVRNPATGQIVCRSQIDPTARVGSGAAGAAALATDIANCVPYNPFGDGDNRAAAAYIVEDTLSRARLEQYVVSGFVSGDTSEFFELPGGPARFAVGAEYRREAAFYQADPLVETGRTFYNALPTFSPDPFEVKEAYAEVQLPLLRDVPFFQELTLSGAGRVANYAGGAGTVYAYNAGLEWQPIRDIRFRANYGRSVRAPNYTETGFPLTQNFAPGFADPCRPNQVGSGTQFRAANCAADLGALQPNLANLANYSLELQSGSNPDLEAETSDSYTIGGVFQPRFLPGFSLTVDYFDITVNDVITSLAAATIVNSCYDQPQPNQFCDLFERYKGSGTGPAGEIPGQILQGNLRSIPLNFAALKRRGIDFEVAYRTAIGPDSRLNTRLIYTHQLQNSNFTNPITPDFENQILNELGDPQDEFRWDLDLTFGAFTVGYQMQYIGPQSTSTFEAFNPLQDRLAQNADQINVTEYPAVTYHDLRFEFRVRGEGGEQNNNLNFYFGVDNLTDVNPPLDLTGIGGGSGIYQIRGRNYYAGFRARF